MKTYVAKPSTIEKKWYVVDASGQTLGRLSTVIADTLRGKRKPIYTPNIDTGDFVVVVNAEKVVVTGNKADAEDVLPPHGLSGRHQERDLRQAARPPARRGHPACRARHAAAQQARRARRLRKLKIYAGPEHPHEAQNPEVLEIKE